MVQFKGNNAFEDELSESAANNAFEGERIKRAIDIGSSGDYLTWNFACRALRPQKQGLT